MDTRKQQLSLDLPVDPGWGGVRAGAGRKPRGDEPGIPHRHREGLDARFPVHVTLRVRAHVWQLRSRRCFEVFAAAARGVSVRQGFRVVHYSVQGNHLHLVVGADDSAALAGGVKAFAGRLAKGLNALMGRRGPVFTDRYHAHALTTPTEVRNALRYVLGNFASHAARRGAPLGHRFVDPYSSAAPAGPDGLPPLTARPRTWLLSSQARDAMNGTRLRRSASPAPGKGI